MLGVGFAWVFVALIVILPISLVAAALVGGIPAALVYFISNSWIGAVIAGVPLALLALILVSSAGAGLYLIFRSSVWTLTYLEVRGLEKADNPPAAEAGNAGAAFLPPDPQPET